MHMKTYILIYAYNNSYVHTYVHVSYLHIAVYGPWLTKEITYTGIITYDNDDFYLNYNGRCFKIYSLLEECRSAKFEA